MKAVILLAIILFCAISLAVGQTDKKITICHVPPGNPLKPVEITISLNAWKVQGGLNVSNTDLDLCYKQTGSADSFPAKHAHCPGGHGGDYVLLDGQSCYTPTSRSKCFAACQAAKAAGVSENAATEADVRNSCITNPKGKTHICHVPPGRTDKFLELDISCNAWKTCKANDENGFHCPGGHGGDFQGSSCGLPIGTPGYDALCSPSKTVCYVPASGSGTDVQTIQIGACAWVESGSCEEGEYGPDCHGGDLEGACPAVPNCPGASLVAWTGVPFKSTGYCKCSPKAKGSCKKNAGSGKWECECKVCDPSITCKGLGTCDNEGNCICNPGESIASGDGSCDPNPTPIPEDPCNVKIHSPASYSQFHVIALGSARLKRGDVEGSLFVTENLKVNDYSVGKKSDGSGCSACLNSPALVLGGALDGSVSICGGNFQFWEGLTLESAFDINPACAVTDTTGSFDSRYGDIGTFATNARIVSRALSRLDNTDEFDSNKETIKLQSSSADLQVFELNSCSMQKVKEIKVLDGTGAPTYIFNVAGNCDIDLEDIGFDAFTISNSARNLWNFVKTTSIRLENLNLPGTILAPYATLTLKTGGSVTGQVIVQEIKGVGQYKESPFTGCLSNVQLKSEDGDCLIKCPNKATQDPDTCHCTCGNTVANTCGDNLSVNNQFAIDSATCGCYCPINDCPFGSAPNDACTACKVCSNIPEGARIIQRGKCDYIPAPVCDNPTNPFNSAADFSVFITSGDFKSSNNRVGGRIAANGNIELNNFLVGDDFETSDFQCVVGGGPFSLAAAGTVIFPGNGQVLAGSIASSDNGVNIGSAITGSLSDPTCSASVNIQTTGILFDPDSFKNLADDLKNIEESDKVRFGTNGKKDSDPNAWVFTGRTGSKDGSVDVFYVPKGEDLIKTGYWELNNVDEASTIIVNIGGSSAGFNNLDLSAWKNWSSRVIFNFYEAQSLTIQGVAVQGSILAPRAIVSASNGQVRGQIIAKQWFDGSSVYVQWNGGFSGCIPSSAL